MVERLGFLADIEPGPGVDLRLAPVPPGNRSQWRDIALFTASCSSGESATDGLPRSSSFM